MEATQLANAAIEHRYLVKHEVAMETADGQVFVGRDEADIAANRSVAGVLARREVRGRIPMVAELLGFLEGAAAWKRGHTYDRARVLINGVEIYDAEAEAHP